jgi:hypothetical protein
VPAYGGRFSGLTRIARGAFFLYPLDVSLKRKLASLAASLIAAGGMFTGHALGGSGSDSTLAANLVGILSWVVAGVTAVLIDRSVPPRAVGFASLGLPLVWFGGLLVSEGVGFWLLGLVMLGLFALLAGASAAGTRWMLRPRTHRSRRVRRTHH